MTATPKRQKTNGLIPKVRIYCVDVWSVPLSLHKKFFFKNRPNFYSCNSWDIGKG